MIPVACNRDISRVLNDLQRKQSYSPEANTSSRYRAELKMEVSEGEAPVSERRWQWST